MPFPNNCFIIFISPIVYVSKELDPIPWLCVASVVDLSIL